MTCRMNTTMDVPIIRKSINHIRMWLPAYVCMSDKSMELDPSMTSVLSCAVRDNLAERLIQEVLRTHPVFCSHDKVKSGQDENSRSVAETPD